MNDDALEDLIGHIISHSSDIITRNIARLIDQDLSFAEIQNDIFSQMKSTSNALSLMVKSRKSLFPIIYQILTDKENITSLFNNESRNANFHKKVTDILPKLIPAILKALKEKKSDLALNVLTSLSLENNPANIDKIEKIISSLIIFIDTMTTDLKFDKLDVASYQKFLRAKLADEHLIASVEDLIQNAQILIKNNPAHFLKQNETLAALAAQKQKIYDNVRRSKKGSLKENIANFKNTDLELAYAVRAIKKLDLSGLEFKDTKLLDQDLSNINFSCSSLDNVSFKDCDLTNCNFSFCNFSGKINLINVKLDQQSLDSIIRSLALSAAQGDKIELHTNIPELTLWYNHYYKVSSPNAKKTVISNHFQTFKKTAKTISQGNEELFKMILEKYQKLSDNVQDNYLTDIFVLPQTSKILEDFYKAHHKKRNYQELLFAKIREVKTFYSIDKNKNNTTKSKEWFEDLHEALTTLYGAKTSLNIIQNMQAYINSSDDIREWYKKVEKGVRNYTFYNLAGLIFYSSIIPNIEAYNGISDEPQLSDVAHQNTHEQDLRLLQKLHSFVNSLDLPEPSTKHTEILLSVFKEYNINNQEKLFSRLGIYSKDIEKILASNSGDKQKSLKEIMTFSLRIEISQHIFPNKSIAGNKYHVYSDILSKNATIIINAIRAAQQDNKNITQVEKILYHIDLPEAKKVNISNLPSLLLAVSPETISSLFNKLSMDLDNADKILENLLNDKELFDFLLMNKEILSSILVEFLDHSNPEKNKEDLELIFSTLASICNPPSQSGKHTFLEIDEASVSILTSSLISLLKNNPKFTQNIIDNLLIQHQSPKYKKNIEVFINELRNALKDSKQTSLEAIYKKIPLKKDLDTFLEDFTNTQIINRRLEFTTLADLAFKNLEVKNFSFASSTLENLSFENSTLQNVDFTDVSINKNVDFSNCKMDLETYLKLIPSLSKAKTYNLHGVDSIKLCDSSKNMQTISKYDKARVEFIGHDLNKLLIDKYVNKLVETKIITQQEAITLCSKSFEDFDNLMTAHQEAVTKLLQEDSVLLTDLMQQARPISSIINVINSNRDKLHLVNKIQEYSPIQKDLKPFAEQEKLSLLSDMVGIFKGKMSSNYGNNLLHNRPTIFGKILNKIIQYYAPPGLKFFYDHPNPSAKLIESFSFTDIIRLIKVIRKYQPHAIQKILEISNDFGWSDQRSPKQVSQQYAKVIQHLFKNGIFTDLFTSQAKDGSNTANLNFATLVQGYVQTMTTGDLFAKQAELEKYKNELKYQKIANNTQLIMFLQAEIKKLNEEILLLQKNNINTENITKEQAITITNNLRIIVEIVQKHDLLFLVNDYFTNPKKFSQTYQAALSKLDAQDYAKLIEAFNVIQPLIKIHQNFQIDFSINKDTTVISLADWSSPLFADKSALTTKENFVYSKHPKTRELLYQYFVNISQSDEMKDLFSDQVHANQLQVFGGEVQITLNALHYNNISCTNSEFQNVEIRNWSKNHSNSKINFTKSIFNKVEILDSNFANANMSLVQITDCTVKDTNLDHVDLSNSYIQFSNFSNCEINKTNFNNATLDHVTFKNIKDIDISLLNKAKLSNCRFENCTFKSDKGLDKLKKHATLIDCKFLKQDTPSQPPMRSSNHRCFFSR